METLSMKLLYGLMMTLSLISCDKVVDKTLVKSEISNKTISCHYYGYCMNCGIDYSGKYSCGFKMYYACPGKQAAKVQEDTYKLIFESRKERIRTKTTVLEELGDCQ